MDNRFFCKQLRSQMNINGWIMLLYYAIMNVMVSIMMFAQAFVSALQGEKITEELLTQMLLSNGWGYLIASAIGFALMLLWKKKDFCFRLIWRSDKRMTCGSFFVLLCLFLGGQGFFQLFSWGLEFLLNLLGLSGMAAMETAH